jgi:hypothetical protein
VEENSEEKEFAKGLPGMNLGVGWETRGDSRRRLTSSSQQVLLLVQEWGNLLWSWVYAKVQLQRRGE